MSINGRHHSLIDILLLGIDSGQQFRVIRSCPACGAARLRLRHNTPSCIYQRLPSSKVTTSLNLLQELITDFYVKLGLDYKAKLVVGQICEAPAL
jgi:hypothetical protein